MKIEASTADGFPSVGGDALSEGVDPVSDGNIGQQWKRLVSEMYMSTS